MSKSGWEVQILRMIPLQSLIKVYSACNGIRMIAFVIEQKGQ